MSAPMWAQNTNGVIKFRYKRNFIKINETLPWMTQQEKDRAKLTWGKMNTYKGTPYALHFNGDKSVYFELEEENDYGYSGRKDQYTLVRDYQEESCTDLVELMGKKHVIKDLPKYKWKILNEIKEIGGYLCMKAETTVPHKNQVVHAWFTDAIPVQGGPEGFYGLPGMILEINKNDGGAIVTAETITMHDAAQDLPLPKKEKGKKIERAGFNKKIKNFIDDQFAAERNPFWRLKY